jgi:rhodanese-related sulfurtransferase
MRPAIDRVMDRARRRIGRLSPADAAGEMQRGALLVDTRSESQRAAQGEIPGALIIERNVLEWRLDPTSPSRIPQMTGHDVRVIVLCAQGYSSSLAALSLQQLGLTSACDVVGGFEGWKAAGMPIRGGTED